MITRDEEIVRTLANAVRVMSLQQIAREWWTDTRWGRSRATRTLDELAVEDLLHVRRVLSRPIKQLKSPIFNWEVGDGQPNFAQLSAELHRRAMRSPAMVTIVFATRRSVTLFGGNRLPTIKLTQTTHDLHVSEVFLHYRQSGRKRQWLSEDQLPADWPIRERPDAVLCDDDGQIVRALEYGGDYPAERLANLHDGLAWAGLSYELW